MNPFPKPGIWLNMKNKAYYIFTTTLSLKIPQKKSVVHATLGAQRQVKCSWRWVPNITGTTLKKSSVQESVLLYQEMTRNLHLKSKDKKFRKNLPLKFTFIFHKKNMMTLLFFTIFLLSLYKSMDKIRVFNVKIKVTITSLKTFWIICNKSWPSFYVWTLNEECF